MTKKDYIEFAKVIKGTLHEVKTEKTGVSTEGAINSIVGGIADVCQQDNPLFDRDKFFAYIYTR